ncbi:hypothetical protein [Sulfitobacter pacificus]|uniref:DUF4345 domain-containing protein n=1 Tax=Sulfitobacter pacificus TaxID=1499314 RepID=A0ABQ5VN55_9RHOB|nr:hypothetical protein [Sulfitobacter pacificus]GLQ28603.1 hypothetical protein GCM10007927_34060 [Sulfitobacter pacificus]
MDFRTISRATAAIFGTLCLTLIMFPELIYWLFSLKQAEVGDILAKRAGVLFLGFSVLCFMARDAVIPDVQRVVVVTVMTAMGAMAALGIYEFWRGSVGPGIWIAILVELLISGLFYRAWRQGA